MPDKEEFQTIFRQLKKILQKYESHLVVTQNTDENYSLNTPFSKKFQKEVYFGAVQVKKNYVSYHLMPIYIYPDLLNDISDNLKKRMQGKSCFNFRTSDKELFQEITRLTQKSVARIKRERLL